MRLERHKVFSPKIVHDNINCWLLCICWKFPTWHSHTKQLNTILYRVHRTRYLALPPSFNIVVHFSYTRSCMRHTSARICGAHISNDIAHSLWRNVKRRRIVILSIRLRICFFVTRYSNTRWCCYVFLCSYDSNITNKFIPDGKPRNVDQNRS